MSRDFARAVRELLGVDGVLGAFVQGLGGLEVYRRPAGTFDVEPVARGFASALNALGAEATRLELRFRRGRVLVRPLAGGATFGLVLAPEVATSSLSFALAAVAAAAAQEAAAGARRAEPPPGDASCRRIAGAFGALARFARAAQDPRASADRLRAAQQGDCPHLRVLPDGSVSAHAHVLERVATGPEWAGARRWAERFVAACEAAEPGFAARAGVALQDVDRWLLDLSGVS